MVGNGYRIFYVTNFMRTFTRVDESTLFKHLNPSHCLVKWKLWLCTMILPHKKTKRIVRASALECCVCRETGGPRCTEFSQKAVGGTYFQSTGAVEGLEASYKIIKITYYILLIFCEYLCECGWVQQGSPVWWHIRGSQTTTRGWCFLFFPPCGSPASLVSVAVWEILEWWSDSC